MTFMELVNLRESNRKYSDKKVSRELIDTCLEAARLAPSACNSQPWSFIVVDDEKTKNEIVDKTMGGIYKSNAFVKSAPVIIIAVTEHSSYIARMGGFLRDVKYNLIDMGIAGEHLALQAAELGLGTCWLGWFNEKELKKILGLSKSTRIDIIFSLGYPDEATPHRNKARRTLEEIRSYFIPK